MHPDPEIQALELLPVLRQRWGRTLRKSLRSLLIRQCPQWVDVQLRFRNGAERHYFLGFICAGDRPLFLPHNDIVDNARAFLDLDPITLSQCFRGLFRRSALRTCDALYEGIKTGN
ncbi:MAG: hypothetical protein EOO16_14930 [Chitinophagaceae bacterium]|nr:MAG: hypothetical protein EOO16_14930 [Chitinophagaceae bacterium]